LWKTALFVLAISCSLVAQGKPDHVVRMSFPDGPGLLVIDVGATDFQTRLRPDGKEVQMQAFGRKDGLQISAFLQRVTFPASAEKCRDEWWPGTKKSMALRRDDLQEAIVKDGIARVEFIIPEFQGLKVQQKNIHAYLGGGNLCVEVHLSKVLFKQSDQKLFDDELATVRLDPDQVPSPTSAQTQTTAPADDAMHYLGLGSKFICSRIIPPPQFRTKRP
jgi:hypothetical protein